MNTERIAMEEFLAAWQSGSTVIDVRSPGEYRRGHLPGAINLPLFTDEERSEIGTLYKQKGRNTAVLRGLEMVGPKMALMAAKATQWQQRSKPLLVHCWRGGMRSESVAWLFRTAGVRTAVLDGGYKAWRRYLQELFEKPHRLVLLSGPTGSGKTRLLHELQRQGEQVIDLEKLANHKGSSFGALGMEPQPSVEHFENLLAVQLLNMNPDRPLWLEDESHTIGRVFIPIAFWKQMQQAPVFVVRPPIEMRLPHLLKEYGCFPKEQLAAAILRIKKRLGGLETQEAIAALNSGNLEIVARIALKYYDKAYQYQLKERTSSQVIEMEIWHENLEQMGALLRNRQREQSAQM